MSVYPIGFSINSSKIVKDIPHKTRLLAFIEPGNLSTYIYDNEEDYYNGYKESFFALTKKKAGWDCMRHYEILANGCIPFFQDLDKCPSSIMIHLPKETILNSMKLYNNMDTEENKTLYYKYLSELLEYTRNNLTNTAMANYILKKTNKNNVKKILYLSGDTNPDYLRCVTLSGFKELFGENCHDFPKIPHIYEDCENYRDLYGKGISYTRLVSTNLHNNNFDETVVSDIENRLYDIVIYGSYHRGIPFWDHVNKFYKPNEIILMCGEDEHYCNYRNFTDRGHNVFVRELYY